MWALVLYVALTNPANAMTKVVVKPYSSYYECMTAELKMRSGAFQFVCERNL